MKAALLRGYGSVDMLELGEHSAPEPKPNEVQVRVESASINPIDWKLRRGDMKRMRPLTFPTILGRDASGEVTKVGRDVKVFKPGDRVMGLVDGGYAELVTADTNSWAKVPDSVNVRDAAALPLVTLTGAQLIEDEINARPKQTILVTGAVGGVGRAAVYAVKSRGAEVWAGVRASQRDTARELSADHVVAIDDDDEIAALPLLDAIADTVGGTTLLRLLPKLKAGGTLGTVLGDSKAAKARGLKVRAMFTHPDGIRLRALGEAVGRGELTIPIARRFPLAKVREAQKLAEQGGIGKVLLMLS